MMKKVVKFFYFVGLLFWGSFLIHSLFMFAAYNGFGSLFKYVEPRDIDLNVQRDSSLVYISYVYSVNGEKFQNEFKTSSNYFDSFNIDTVTVQYNQRYPSVSIIKGLPNMQRRERIIIVISIIFIVVQTIFYKLAIRKKNLRTYGIN